jgi:hypothetical protein
MGFERQLVKYISNYTSQNVFDDGIILVCPRSYQNFTACNPLKMFHECHPLPPEKFK